MATSDGAQPPDAEVAPPPRRAFSTGFLWTAGILLGILLTFAAAVFLLGVLGHSEGSRVEADLRMLTTSLKTYQMVSGRFPTTEQGLAALITEPVVGPRPRQWFQLLSQLPKDPWGNDYVYLQPGRPSSTGFDLFSRGKDGLPGTEDDIGNW